MNNLGFELKPKGYKTVNQWKKEGMCPASSAVVKEYAATNYKGEVMLRDWNAPVSIDNVYLHEYVAPGDVIPTKTQETPFSFADLEGKKVVCFDTETTGFSKWDEILQITMTNRDGELLNTYIKPDRHKTWKKAAEINHIYPEDVQDAPSAKEVAKRVREILSNTDILIGHNVSFDVRMVEQCMGISFADIQIVDTLDLFREEFPKGKHKLRNAVETYCPELLEWFDKGAHKSDTDTKATLEVFFRIAERAKKRSVSKEKQEEIPEEIEFE